MSEFTDVEQFAIDWQYGRLGGFKEALVQPIMKADMHNIEMLRMGFPVEVEAIYNYQNIDGWMILMVTKTIDKLDTLEDLQ
jgi:hypothetical protein